MTSIHAILMPALRFLPAEVAHGLTIRALACGMGPRDGNEDPHVLATNLWDLHFRNPFGLSAGFDKGAQVPDAMLAAGFGFVEAGTVTPLPQPGNPRPRLFRLPEDGAVINRLGFNGGGLTPFVDRISRRKYGLGPFGANVGRNKSTVDAVADYVTCIEAVVPHADYIVLNVSSPNTPGLRRLQGSYELARLLEGAMEARARAIAGPERGPPLIVKISPDLNPGSRADLAQVVLQSGIDGMIVANTTVARPRHLSASHQDEAGGLSGKPLFPIALAAVRDMYRLTGGRIPLIGSGGIASGADAYAMIRAGASLVQLYTALVFRGPVLIPKIKSELATLLERDGLSSVSDAVGLDSDITECGSVTTAMVA